jgi:hypothetical protein
MGFVVVPGFAQPSRDSAAAQGLFDEAKALMAAGKANEACPKFEESQRLDPGSGTLLNLARCYEQTARIASAWSAYLEAAAAAKSAGNAVREEVARERAAVLAPRVSKLTIEVPADARVAGLQISRDGIDVGAAEWGVAIPANEGSHEIVAKAKGHSDWKGVAQVHGEGTIAKIEVPKLVEAASPASTTSSALPQSSANAPEAHRRSSGLGTQRILALAAGGVGVAGLAVGTVFGVKAMNDKSGTKGCSANVCPTDDAVTAGNDAHGAGNVATIGMIVGAVGLAGGLALWFTAPKEAPPVQAALGFGTVQVRGAW